MKKNNAFKDTLTGLGMIIGATMIAGAAIICDTDCTTTTTTTDMPSLDGPKVFIEVMDLKRKADEIYHNITPKINGYINMDGSAKIRECSYCGYITYNYKKGGLINDIRYPNGEIIIFRYDYKNRISEVKLHGKEHKFRYDYKNRIVEETCGTYSKYFEYDYRGNIIGVRDTKGYWRRYEYNHRNQIISEDGSFMRRKIYVYDYRGNLVDIR